MDHSNREGNYHLLNDVDEAQTRQERVPTSRILMLIQSTKLPATEEEATEEFKEHLRIKDTPNNGISPLLHSCGSH